MPSLTGPPLDTIEADLRRAIQDLYNISVTLHSYQSTTSSPALSSYITQLTTHLAPLAPPSNLPTLIPPEIIAYIDSGRNPDIYTREFVELVQKGNATLKSRAEALGKFRDILAAEMRVGLPELREEVGKVLEVTGGAAAGEEIGEDVKEEGT